MFALELYYFIRQYENPVSVYNQNCVPFVVPYNVTWRFPKNKKKVEIIYNKVKTTYESELRTYQYNQLNTRTRYFRKFSISRCSIISQNYIRNIVLSLHWNETVSRSFFSSSNVFFSRCFEGVTLLPLGHKLWSNFRFITTYWEASYKEYRKSYKTISARKFSIVVVII